MMFYKIIQKVILVITLIAPVSVCYAYQNLEGHFSFTLPDGWKDDPQSNVDKWSESTSQQSGKVVRYIAAFHKTTGGDFPAINVQMDNSGRSSEVEIQQFIKSSEQQQEALKIAKGYSKDSTGFGNYEYDKERNVLFVPFEINGPIKQVGVSAMILSSYGSVTFTFYSTENNMKNDSKDFSQIIDSFKFDVGYSYRDIFNNLHYSPDGKFSVNIPSDWVEIPKTNLDEAMSKLKLTGYSCGFQKVSTNYFTYPYILYQIYKGGQLSDNYYYQSFSKAGIKIKSDVDLKDDASYFSVLNSMKVKEGVFDSKRKIWILKNEQVYGNNVVVTSFSIAQMTNYGSVNAEFYSLSSEMDNNLISLIHFCKSFKLDEGAKIQTSADDLITHSLFIDRIPLSAPIRAGIGGATVAGLVWFLIYGLRALIWKGRVPEHISKERWKIAFLFMIISAVFLACMQLGEKSIVPAAILIITAQALKKKDK